MSNHLAIDGGNPVRGEPFPAWPVFDEREERHLRDVLQSGQWGVLAGNKVHEFEQRFAEFQGARFGVCVPNGTLGLEMALRALGVGPGDEIITTPYTFIATVSAVLLAGATPVLVDIDLDTYNLDPAQVAKAVSERTKAILPVHLGGQPADMDALLVIARRHGLQVLEDACQAWGAEWRGQRVGAIGDLGAFSFQSSKNITAGEGGIVITNDEELADLCWSLHNVGRVKGGLWYQHERLGWNLRMTEWQGAVLLAQIERLPEQADRRETSAHYLSQSLSQVPGIEPLPANPRVTRHARHLFIMCYDPAAFGGRGRDEFIAALRAEGIEPCSPGYVPLNHSPAIRRALAERGPADDASWTVDDAGLPILPACPNAEYASQHTIWLFQYALLGSRSDMDSIVEAMTKIQQAWG
ncbi:MAG: DegT/DnrJ/EryC1/StrS family aminotransferase [Chloroflexota bacterium]|nr:DegT/DnrJ/EryC1/StrS family aminotransferase [Chloroflexota bacterium]